MKEQKSGTRKTDKCGAAAGRGKDKRGGSFVRDAVINGILAVVVLAVFAVTVIPQISAAYSPHSNGAYYNGNTEKNNISLMVNVYWGTEYLDGMLDVMETNGVKATFFVGGSWAAENEESIKKIVEKGHELGNHGYYHRDHKTLSEERNREEIYVTHKLIEALIGVKMNLFAPPSGSFGKTTVKAAGELGYKTVMWTKDTIDWRDKDAEIVYSRAVKKPKGGDLILMHPTAHTLEALPRIIKELKKQGFRLCTVSDNLEGK